MLSYQRVLDYVKAEPFRPFRIHMASGRNFDLPARWSATMVKENGQWLIANLHASDNLFDNPLLDSAKRTIGWTGAIGLAVGLAIGLFAGRRRRTA